MQTMAETKKAKKEEAEKKPKKAKEEKKPEVVEEKPKEHKEEEKPREIAETKAEIAAPEEAQKKRRGEIIGVVHVYSSKNNTIVHLSDITGSETIAVASGGMVVKSGREERTPFAAAQASKRIIEVAKERGITMVDMLLRGKGGHAGQKNPGRGASAVIKAFARAGIRIRKIEDVTPIPHGGCKPPGGKRGRRV